MSDQLSGYSIDFGSTLKRGILVLTYSLFKKLPDVLIKGASAISAVFRAALIWKS
jgi:hypothetical protein